MVKMPHWPIPYGHKPIDLGFERIKKLLGNLGNPHQSLPPVIHIAGTNGKGSTLSFIRTIMEFSGYKVHSYTSPHLTRFNERIRLAGKEITDEEIFYYGEICRKACHNQPITFFEGTTALAFLAFANVSADIVLLETGMGGRLDATNLIEAPFLSIITPIDLDHVEYLVDKNKYPNPSYDDLLLAIAREKAEIIKQNIPSISSWQHQIVQKELQKKCSIMNSPFFSYRQNDWQTDSKNYSLSNSYLFSSNHFGQVSRLELKPSLIGIHQIVNSSTAAFAGLFLAANGFSKVSHNNISYGISKTYWPARLEQIKSGVLYNLLNNDSELWLDGAHNNAGSQMLAASIDQMSYKPLYLIHGRTANKDISGFLSYFNPNIVRFICCMTVESEPLAEQKEKIYMIATNQGFKAAIFESIADAVKFCLKQENNIRIVICGSLYLAADVLKANEQ